MRVVAGTRREPQRAAVGFTLVETVIALLVIAVALVSMLTLYPIGLQQAEAGLLETRGAHVAQRLFTTLRSCSYTEVNCFGKILDLSSLPANGDSIRFYAQDEGCEDITPQPGPESRFLLRVGFEPLPGAPSGVEAKVVTLAISSVHREEPQASFQTIIVRPPL